MDLANLWGVSEGTVKNYLRKDRPTKIPLKNLELLSNRYNIDLNWLMKGNSESEIGVTKTHRKSRDTPSFDYLYTDKSGINQLVADKTDDAAIIPFYDVDVMASPIEVFSDQTTTPTFQMSLPGFADCDFAINVHGSSMYPTF